MMVAFASCSKSVNELKPELTGEWEMVTTRKSPCRITLNEDGSYTMTNLMAYGCFAHSDFGATPPTPALNREKGNLCCGSGKWNVDRDRWKSFDDIIAFNGSIDGLQGHFGCNGYVVKTDGEWEIRFVVGDPDSYEFQKYRKVVNGSNKRRNRHMRINRH